MSEVAALKQKQKNKKISYIGQLEKKDGIWYGIELTDRNETEKGKQLFVKPKELKQILAKSKKKSINLEQMDVDVQSTKPKQHTETDEKRMVLERQLNKHSAIEIMEKTNLFLLNTNISLNEVKMLKNLLKLK